MSDIYKKFEAYLEQGDRILDLGCGSGRDSRYFLSEGYAVVALDPSIKMCEATAQLTSLKPLNISAQEINFENEFNGIWACASLLHVPKSVLPCIIYKIRKSLKKDGVFYSSWKLGDCERVDEGKYSVYYNQESILNILNEYMTTVESWINNDHIRSNLRWINIICKRGR